MGREARERAGNRSEVRRRAEAEAKLLDSDFEAPFQVLSYKVGANGGNISVYREVPNEGARWGSGADALIKQAGPGSSIFFDQIRVKGPDGKVRELPGIYFNLR